MRFCSSRQVLILFFSVVCCRVYSQTNNQSATRVSLYDSLKAANRLLKDYVVKPNNSGREIHPVISARSTAAASVLCNCLIPVDSTFQAAPFEDVIISSSYDPPFYANDDGSTPLITLPFNFCFYGQTQINCYINNNGNISFGTPYSIFTANGFPDQTFTMIAPFWADVDTRGNGSGYVYYKVTSSYMIVRWNGVGYFNRYTDKLNDFQLIITDGIDPILPAGNNVSFCYGDMQWTTGDASLGSGGFGGSPATVGANLGNGMDYIQIGTFDAPGTTYDGPFGAVDQVSWLDNQSFYFNTCNAGAGNNLPPIINSSEVCDTISICVGDTIPVSATLLSPEQGQVTTASMTASSSGLTVTTNNSGNPAVVSGQFIASAANTGYNTITISGTDNGTPPATTTANVVINVIGSVTANFSANPPAPVVAPATVQFTDLSSGAISWLWDFGDGTTSVLQNPTHTYTSDSLYIVTLTITLPGGCDGTQSLSYLVTDSSATVIPQPVTAPNVITPNSDGNNDLLFFTNLAEYPQSTLYVYSRWGNLIYSNADYQNDWTPNVSDGVYYYVLSAPSLGSSITGFFHVIK
jgi:gliding motility-associated-like protein